MKVAYLDCFSGISGDMFVGALIDAGLPFELLREMLGRLPIKGYDLEVRREGRNHLHGTRFIVHVAAGEHVHRSIVDIRQMILEADLSDWVKTKSVEIFESIARVEGKIHDRPPEEIHFHEIGATDSIVDIVGSVLGVEVLGIGELHASALPLGTGFVNVAHGRIPVPAPATVALLESIPVRGSETSQEMVTPTGAALVKGLVHSFGSLPPMVIEKVGYGVGSRNLPDRPNLLRMIIGQSGTGHTDTVVILEANLDDINPEWLGFLMERLFRAGALDVVFLPVQMKKNRPGTAIQVIGKPEHKDLLTEILFSESTTLGIRFRFSERETLKRSLVEIDSPWGKLTVKKVGRPDGSSIFLPEYEACRTVAEERNIPLQEIYYWVISANRR
ncbi:MAG: TIGR00299 family protein [Deltaproteobacteria bacterium HGW-Deltaproteobacteria-21]|nr:MAG: TIGR00299 family protein [Deltaproteobacteria bacterium HGW-Deltaproteobacteria-21]